MLKGSICVLGEGLHDLTETAGKTVLNEGALEDLLESSEDVEFLGSLGGDGGRLVTAFDWRA